MRRSRFSEQEVRIGAERRVKYQGAVRVKLEVLHFPQEEGKELSRENIERLKEVFRTDHVRRLEPRNYVPAVVEPTDLHDAVQAAGISVQDLLTNTDGNPPTLTFPSGFQLTCLHGRHRVQAGREILPLADAWWIVDLYLADLSPKLTTTLVEEYANEKRPSDGEVYWKIRQYEQERNLCFKNRWKAILKTTSRRGLRQLDDHEELAAAIDDVMVMPGMRDDLRLSTIPKITSMKCDEEVVHYLEDMKEFWSTLLPGGESDLRKVDRVTVKVVELKAPGNSKQDAQILHGRLLSGQIFSAFNRQERKNIWNKLRRTDRLIPSLFTFFEDVKYLNACADCLKRLVKVSRKETVSTALDHKFTDANQISGPYVVEIGESLFVTRSGGTGDRINWGKRQLWLYAMRHYRDMPPDSKKKDKDLLAKAECHGADDTVLYEFAALADRLGFASPGIDRLKQRSSDRETARNALLKARKPGRYRYDDTMLEAYVDQILGPPIVLTHLESGAGSPTETPTNRTAHISL
ncbi:hypothetical protein CC78DRAFT_551975 [Lojkania enalia]|uniref:Uncharacterized protein n=1 Tax=Lojkania enalia TaxID=147567 RepID=A0A9P4KG00_9PLEO|nr:hypothetical protein CC78DRAFT_551975 [Didymosphaeria enalia]